jgi:transposase
MYFIRSKEFFEAGKRRMSGDTALQATSPEMKDLRSESMALNECVADLTLEHRLLKKARQAQGGTRNEIPRIREVGNHSHRRRVAPANQEDL